MFKIGDKVLVKNDLVVGKYYNNWNHRRNIFSPRMEKYMGEEAIIIENINNAGYKLNIDMLHTYTSSMLEPYKDTLARSEYVFNTDVEEIIAHSLKAYYKDLIDKSLDNRMFENNPKQFKEIINAYNKYS